MAFVKEAAMEIANFDPKIIKNNQETENVMHIIQRL